MPSPVRADTLLNMFCPPHSSAITSCFASSVRTRSGSASGLSILLTATTIGTPAAFACWIASMVCGMTPSSAATTITTTVGGLGAARAHCGEGRVTRRVQKSDRAAWRLDVVSPDVLRNAAGLAGRDLGAAHVVEQRSLAVIDVPHHRHHRSAHLELFGRGLAALQAFLDLILAQQLGGVAEFLDHQHRRIALDRLIDGGHDAEVHQHLDDFGGLHRHLLRQLGHRDGLPERDLALDRRGGHLEGVLGLAAADRHGARLEPFLFLVARADVTGDMQLFAAIARALLVVRFLTRGGRRMRMRRMRLARRLGRTALAFALGLFCRTLVRQPPRLVQRLFARLLFLDASPVLGLEAFALAPLGLGLLAQRPLRLLGLAPLGIELLLLGPRLALEHVAFYIGALAPDLDVHRARTALVAREFELALGLALERDAARRRALAAMTVAATQVRQQLELGFLADHVLRTGHGDSGLIELRDQPVHRNLQYVGKLGNRYVSHLSSP